MRRPCGRGMVGSQCGNEDHADGCTDHRFPEDVSRKAQNHSDSAYYRAQKVSLHGEPFVVPK